MDKAFLHEGRAEGYQIVHLPQMQMALFGNGRFGFDPDESPIVKRQRGFGWVCMMQMGLKMGLFAGGSWQWAVGRWEGGLHSCASIFTGGHCAFGYPNAQRDFENPCFWANNAGKKFYFYGFF
jgi:hypothetical protein